MWRARTTSGPWCERSTSAAHDPTEVVRARERSGESGAGPRGPIHFGVWASTSASPCSSGPRRAGRSAPWPMQRDVPPAPSIACSPSSTGAPTCDVPAERLACASPWSCVTTFWPRGDRGWARHVRLQPGWHRSPGTSKRNCERRLGAPKGPSSWRAPRRSLEPTRRSVEPSPCTPSGSRRTSRQGGSCARRASAPIWRCGIPIEQGVLAAPRQLGERLATNRVVTWLDLSVAADPRVRRAGEDLWSGR